MILLIPFSWLNCKMFSLCHCRFESISVLISSNRRRTFLDDLFNLFHSWTSKKIIKYLNSPFVDCNSRINQNCVIKGNRYSTGTAEQVGKFTIIVKYQTRVIRVSRVHDDVRYAASLLERQSCTYHHSRWTTISNNIRSNSSRHCFTNHSNVILTFILTSLWLNHLKLPRCDEIKMIFFLLFMSISK